MKRNIMIDDLELAQLLCTRLCHDLAGPIGAVSSGVELMGADPALIDEEILALLSSSALAGARKLKFMRIAFGWSGGGDLALEQVENAFKDYLNATAGPSGAPTLSWADMETLDVFGLSLGDNFEQVLANVVLVGLEVQPRCDRLAIRAGRNEGELFIEVVNKVLAGAPRVREEIVGVVTGNGQHAIGPQTIQAHLVNRLLSASGGKVTIRPVSDGIITKAEWNQVS